MRLEESEARRSGAAYVTAAVIGITSTPAAGQTEAAIEKLSFWGMPGTVTAAILAKAGATFASGDMADYLNGAGDAAAIIAISKFVQRQEVAGMGAAPRARVTQSATATEAALRRRLRETMSDEDIDAEIAELARG
jgi:hypothetical protein